MLDQQQRVGDPACAPFLDQRALQCERFAVRHQAEAPDVERPHHLSDRRAAALRGPRYI